LHWDALHHDLKLETLNQSNTECTINLFFFWLARTPFLPNNQQSGLHVISSTQPQKLAGGGTLRA